MADITLTAADGHSLTAYRADAPDPVGGVVVVQEIFGVNPHIRSVVDRFAAAGFSAIAPALFDRSEVGVELPYDVEGMTKGRGIAWGELTIDDAVTDVVAAADALAADIPPDRAEEDQLELVMQSQPESLRSAGKDVLAYSQHLPELESDEGCLLGAFGLRVEGADLGQVAPVWKLAGSGASFFCI